MGGTGKRRLKKWGVIIFGVALLMRIGHLTSVSRDPVADVLVLDSLAYDTTAQDIAFGEGMPREVYFQAPTYPYFLAVCYRMFGHNLDLIRFFQILADSLSAVLIMALTAGILTPVSGIVAGFGMALYPVLIFQSSLILKSSFTIFLVVLLLYITACPGRKRLIPWSLPLGVIAGLTAATQGSFLLQLPFVALWIVVESGISHVKKWVTAGFLFGVGVFLIIGPIALRNYYVGGEKVLLTAQGGANFYLGNSPYSDGTSKRPPNIRITPEHEQADFHREAERITDRSLTAHEASSFWFSEGKKWIRKNPYDALRLQVHKFGLFWNKVEIPDNYDFDFYRQHSPWIQIPQYPFLPLGAMGVLGMIMAAGYYKKTWLLHLWIISYCLIVVAFHVYSRYRLPVVAFLWPFAGFAVVQIVTMAKAGQLKKLVIWTAAGLGLGGLMSLQLTHYTFAQSYFNRGSAFNRMGDFEMAEQAYRMALKDTPDYVPALTNLGKLYYQNGQESKARELWVRALVLEPDSEEIHSNLGILAIQSGDFNTARYHFDKSVRIQPYYFLGWLHLGQLHQLQGCLDSGVNAFRQALKLDPGNVQAQYGLASCLDQMNHPDTLESWILYVRMSEGVPSEVEYVRGARERIRVLRGKETNE